MAELPHHLFRRGERWRAPYASNPAASRGRVHTEPEDPLRSVFQRDRDRIVHSNAFRRLMHKTQVFIQHEGDHFRTRLTHSLEVAQIARSIARPLGLDEDLAEALALAHDLGHPPFGHAGERALDQALAAHGGFDHNAQSLRVVTRLERRYAAFDGLNLSWETHEGLVKHNGPVLNDAGNAVGSYASHGLPPAILAFQAEQDLDLIRFAGPEAQAAAISDDIAYDCHDLEDGLRAGLIALRDLHDLPLVGALLDDLGSDSSDFEAERATPELIRRMISAMIRDVLHESTQRLAKIDAKDVEDVRSAGRALIGFSAAMAREEAAVKQFLLERIYRHDAVMRPVKQAETVVRELFAVFLADPAAMPDSWRARHAGEDASGQARCIADYVAGMTDRYATAEHRRLLRSNTG